MTTFQNVAADTDVTGTNAKRFTNIWDARAIAYTVSIICIVSVVSVVSVASFAPMGRAHFAPTLATDLRHQSELLSQAGATASRKAVDVYRGLMRVSMRQYEPKLAASLHQLSARLSEAGDGVGALAAIQEAVEMRRRLARYSTRDSTSFEQSRQLLSQIETREASRIKTAVR